jgi:hypothetical protein
MKINEFLFEKSLFHIKNSKLFEILLREKKNKRLMFFCIVYVNAFENDLYYYLNFLLKCFL